MASTINASNSGSGGLISTGDASGVLALQTANGTTAVTIDTSQNVGIGTTTALLTSAGRGNLTLNGSTDSLMAFGSGGTAYGYINATTSAFNISAYQGSTPIVFLTNGGERMRIDSSGNLLVGVTSSPLLSTAVFYFDGNSRQGLLIKNTANSQNGAAVRFMDYLGNVSGGGIYYTSSNSITYATSSDYRLKENIQPMVGALEKVTQLKPCTFKWTIDGSSGQGFIAHELQEVVPECVTGTKDAVDEEGNPRYQGIDTSFLVATLTAAIQEQQALITAQAETINALTARVVALEGK